MIIIITVKKFLEQKIGTKESYIPQSQIFKIYRVEKDFCLFFDFMGFSFFLNSMFFENNNK